MRYQELLIVLICIAEFFIAILKWLNSYEDDAIYYINKSIKRLWKRATILGYILIIIGIIAFSPGIIILYLVQALISIIILIHKIYLLIKKKAFKDN